MDPMNATVSNGPEVDVPRSEPLEPEPPVADVAPESLPPPAPPAAFPVEAVQLGVSQLFELAAHRRGEHWRLSPSEAHDIAEPLAGELNELAEHAPFLGGAAAAVGGRRMQLAMALGFAVVPRVMADAQLAKDEAAEAALSPGPLPRPRSHGAAVVAPRPAVDLLAEGGWAVAEGGEDAEDLGAVLGGVVHGL